MEEQEKITPAMAQAAEEICDYLFQELKTDDGIHAGTFVAAAARMAGTSLLRSFKFKIPEAEPGTALLSEEANEEGPKLMNLLLQTLRLMEIEPDNEPLAETPAEHLPQLSITQMQERLQEGCGWIAKKHKLDHRQAAFACALACAVAINETKEFLDPNVSAGIAVMGFIEGTKTVPVPF